MKNDVKISLIISFAVACLTFAVSFPSNLLSTSVVRSSAAFLFFAVVTFGAQWIFFRLGSETDEKGTAGQHIDVQTPDETVTLEDIFSVRKEESTPSFQPLKAPNVNEGTRQRG